MSTRALPGYLDFDLDLVDGYVVSTRQLTPRVYRATDDLRTTLDRLETDAKKELRQLLTIARDTLTAFVLRHPNDLQAYQIGRAHV